jgi:hypothetical protein|tara:strand:- start:6653 stop:7252 length:600 start_codon:yes stop_codon:yes gene_type:complete
MYNYLLKNINTFLRNNYYNNYYKNNKSLQNLKTNIFKLEYFLYLRFYVIYLFLYHFKRKNTLNYSLFLNFQHTIGEVCMTNTNYYKIKSENNINFLNKVSIYFFDYLLFNEIYFNNNIKSFNKFIILGNLFLFQLGIIIHKLFKKRIYCIKNKKMLKDHFDFLFLLHGLEDLNNVIEKTKFMNYTNFYFYLNIIFMLLY